ncbi:MSHA biogenesis protein MshI [Vibrio sp. JPW-9-11-11]|nr:MSHA biogenesis protein MshI [Vibrio sp. JPW-9-11-11]
MIARFTGKESSATRLSVVVQPRALFFSSSTQYELPSHLALNDQPWQQVLLEALREYSVVNAKVDIVLHSSLYKTYQIDKPNVPEEELKQALPFLLKDLLSERISDVVLDYLPLSANNKLQVYVVERALISQLYQSLKALSVELERVLVEDEIWGHSAGELQNFLLLQRSQHGPFRVCAFVDAQNAFQRTMRGVTPPLTGVASSILQLDGIALELQRSIDYLSSQLRSTALHKMLICCDEESQQEIVDALNERLSVKVDLLFEPSDSSDPPLLSGETLLQVCENLNHADINLFPQELKPKKEYFTLTSVIGVWGVAAGLLLAMSAHFYYQQSGYQQQLSESQRHQSELQQQVKRLQQQLAQHKPTAAKEAAVARLQLEIDANQRALEAVARFDKTQQVGYSPVMRSLANLGRSDISLTRIRLNAERLDLTGLAQNPQAIPNWVNQFNSELSLVGRTFEQLKIGRNDQEVVTFELYTQREDDR